MVLSKKRVGTVLPMTALVSSEVESGTFVAGEKFIDWLKRSKQQAWQLLSLHQTQLETGSRTKHLPSPYKGYGIGLDPRFLASDSPQPAARWLADFTHQQRAWLPNYAFFCALRDHFGTDDWTAWPEPIRLRRRLALADWRRQLEAEIKAHALVQARLHLAFARLKNTAGKSQVMLIGDFPFYLSLYSPLVWQYQALFNLNKQGKPNLVSGVLAGPKSHYGRQVWGHPLYKWAKRQAWPNLEKLFMLRLKSLASLFDWVRLDHAKGFFHYGAMDPARIKADQFLPGPGKGFLTKLIKFAGREQLQFFVEDTGHNLAQLRVCLAQYRIPGIKIFRFAFNEKRNLLTEQYAQLDQYPVNTFAYTTTHDTEPLMAYLGLLKPSQLKTLIGYLGIKPDPSLVRLAKQIRTRVIESPAQVALLPLQDWLLTTDRINVPGTEPAVNDPNWRYQMTVPIEDLPTDLY